MHTLLLIIVLFFPITLSIAAPIVELIPIDSLSGWQNHSFKGHTRYQFAAENGQPLIKAVSINSASALVKKSPLIWMKLPTSIGGGGWMVYWIVPMNVPVKAMTILRGSMW